MDDELLTQFPSRGDEIRTYPAARASGTGVVDRLLSRHDGDWFMVMCMW
jgi:hypothetical protein